MANIFELFGKIVVDSGDAQREINETSNKAKAFATAMKKGITDAAKWGAGIAAAATTAAVAIGNQIKNIVGETAEYTKTVSNMSQNMGLSIQSYQEWEYVMGRIGVTMEDLQGGIATMHDRMREVDEGSETAIKNFDKLGVSCFDLNGNMKSADVMFKEIIFSLASMDKETERTQLAMEIFSSAGERIAPALNKGVEGIQGYIDQAHELGLVMSEEDIAKGVDYSNTVYDLGAAVEAVKHEIGITLLPSLQELADALLDKLPRIKEKLEEWKPKIEETAGKIVESLEWVIDNPEEVKSALSKIGVGFFALMGFIKPVETAIVLIGAGIIGLAKTFGGGNTETEKFEKTMSDLDETFVQTMQDIEDEYTEANTLLDTIEQLGKKTNKTATETILWKNAVDRMEEILPGFKKHINEETGEIIGGTEAIRDRITAMKEEAEAKAAAKYLQDKYDAVAEAYASTAKLQLDIKTNTALLPSREAAYLEAKAAYEAYDKAHTWKPIGSEARKESERLLKDYQQKFASYNSTLYDIESAKKDLEKLHSEIKKAREELSAAEKAINGGEEGLEKTLSDADKALEGTAESLAAAAESVESAAESLNAANEAAENAEIIPKLAAWAENEMQEELNDMNLSVSVSPVISGSGYKIYPGSSGGVRGGGNFAFADSVFSNLLGRLPGFAEGLDYVPHDDYIARLHKGEKVLTANEASAYRSGEGNARVEAAVNRLGEIMIQVLTAIKEGQIMQLDTGVLVGAMAGAMNDRLGTIATRNGRRN